MDTVEIISRYFLGLSAHQLRQFSQLYPLYKDWNEKINVISRKDIDNLYVNHVLHSLGIAKVVTFERAADVLDVGTGGGFPGIPLAILFPDTNFHLVDSVGKKIRVVREVATTLGMKNVRSEQTRVEQLKGEYDFIVSRAVTRLREFYGWTHHLVKKRSRHSIPNGILYLKGGDLTGELAEIPVAATCYDLSHFFSEDYFLTKKVVHVPGRFK